MPLTVLYGSFFTNESIYLFGTEDKLIRLCVLLVIIEDNVRLLGHTLSRLPLMDGIPGIA
jgi:hypothetical protein